MGAAIAWLAGMAGALTDRYGPERRLLDDAASHLAALAGTIGHGDDTRAALEALWSESAARRAIGTHLAPPSLRRQAARLEEVPGPWSHVHWKRRGLYPR